MPVSREALQAGLPIPAALDPRRTYPSQAGAFQTARAPLPWPAKTCRPLLGLVKRNQNPQGPFAQLFHVEQSSRPEAP